MTIVNRGIAAAAAAWVACGAWAQSADADVAAAGRKAALAAGPAVVTFQLVTKMTMSMKGGESNQSERQGEATGVVIDPNGLAVASLTTIDPSAMVGDLMAQQDMSVRFEVTDLRYLMPDGTEVPGKIVLRDKDLDLAFIRPVARPDAPMAFVDLKNSTPLDLLDTVVLVGRAGKVMNRTITARVDRVKGLIERPRRRYMLDAAQNSDSSNDIGCPGFALDGRIVGLELIKMIRPSGSDADSRMNDLRNNAVVVLVPASDILPIAAQAPEDAPKEATPPAPKPTVAPKPAAAPKAAAPAPKKPAAPARKK